MISYRKLAMRVLGHSPVSAVKTARRPTAKRAAALALTAALVVGMTLPAFADTHGTLTMVTSRFRLVKTATMSHREVRQKRMIRTRLLQTATLLPRLRIQ